ncbi:MAG: amidohydrolase family protein, partial [Candidatus Omnitrophica bacterium]|nr:amidohydrolase family protein [Candidatus Omnitrophota bacterium]
VYRFATESQLPVHVHSQIIEPIGFERVQDPLLSPVLEYVLDVTMCIGKMMMSGTFKKFPKVPFVFPHYGGVLPFVKERFDSTYRMLRGREYVADLGQLPSECFQNLFFDTSGSKSIASLQCALEVTDAAHILFGSDFPANSQPGPALDAVRGSGLKQDEIDKILGSNMLSLIQ